MRAVLVQFHNIEDPICDIRAFRDSHPAAVPVPADNVIEAIGPAEDDRFLIVNVDGEEFHLFKRRDLLQHSFLNKRATAGETRRCPSCEAD